jgi:peptidoglycan/LPS O-acetylase OafA/YrhL
MIAVAWSLSYEMFYYLMIPAAITVCGLRTRSAQERVAFFLAVAAALCMVCVLHGGPARLLMFIAGILLHESLRARTVIALRSRYVVLALIAGLWALINPIGVAGPVTLNAIILAATFFALCYCCLSQPAASLARAFSWTPLRWLGNMSYSYYLLHGLVLKIGFRLLHHAVPAVSQESVFFLAMLVPMFILTLGPTVALFILVERPFSLAPPPATMAPRRTAGNTS